MSGKSTSNHCSVAGSCMRYGRASNPAARFTIKSAPSSISRERNLSNRNVRATHAHSCLLPSARVLAISNPRFRSELVEQKRARHPRPFVLVAVGESAGDLKPALAGQALGIGIAEQRVGPLRFPCSKIGDPTGSVGNVANRRILLIHLLHPGTSCNGILPQPTSISRENSIDTGSFRTS